MPGEKKQTLLDMLNEQGPATYLHMAAFLIGILIAIRIARSKSGMGPRLAFVPLALLPFIIGVAALCHGVRRDSMAIAGYANIVEARGILATAGTSWAPVLLVASVETAILLVISSLLLASRHAGFPSGHPPEGRAGDG